MNILPLSDEASLPDKKSGRPKKFIMPKVPHAWIECMTDFEQSIFWDYINDFRADYPDLIKSDLYFLQQAAITRVLLVRSQTVELQTHELLSASKVHPAKEERAWLELMSVNRRDRNRGAKADTENETKLRAMLLQLSKQRRA